MDVTLGEVGWVDRARLGIAQSNRYTSPVSKARVIARCSRSNMKLVRKPRSFLLLIRLALLLN